MATLQKPHFSCFIDSRDTERGTSLGFVFGPAFKALVGLMTFGGLRRNPKKACLLVGAGDILAGGPSTTAFKMANQPVRTQCGNSLGGGRHAL